MKRRRRLRYTDKYRMPNSVVVPYLASEAWKTRHYRRLTLALQNKSHVQAWCDKHHWTFVIKNNNQHWLFRTHEKKQIEWFPSTGKLVIGQKWDSGIHCYDYLQLIEVFEITLKP